MTYPATNAGPYSYGLDIELTPVSSPSTDDDRLPDADDAVTSEFREKLLSVGVITGRPAPREYRDGGVRVKEVTDEHGNVTTYRNTGDTEQVGVEIRPKTVTLADGRTLTHREKPSQWPGPASYIVPSTLVSALESTGPGCSLDLTADEHPVYVALFGISRDPERRHRPADLR